MSRLPMILSIARKITCPLRKYFAILHIHDTVLSYGYYQTHPFLPSSS